MTIDAICRAYITKTKPGSNIPDGVSFSPLEAVTAVWDFLHANRDNAVLRTQVCAGNWALIGMNEQFEAQLLKTDETL